MSWPLLLGLCAGCYAMKAAGPLLLAHRRLPPVLERLVGLVAVPVLAAMVALQTLGEGRRLVLDARLAALAVAGVLVWRRAPFLVVVLTAALTAALVRVAF
ncbi:MAG: AzlD domain-containing protein [Acidimicrobiia bacterium]